MRANSLILLTLLLVFSSGETVAAPSTTLPPPVPTEPTAAPVATARSRFDIEKLEGIQAETILLEAQALRTKAQIAADGGVAEDMSAPSTAAMAGVTSTLPRISEIAGSGSLSAHLIMPDNSEVQVYAGQSIASTDLTVSKITAQGVVVTHTDGSTVSLPMNDE